MKTSILLSATVFVTIIFHGHLLTAQSNLPSYNPGVENMIPPSPSAAALAKYGSVPVGLSSGVPNISIPLFNYKQGGQGSLSLDISLNYHAGGIKVDEMSSNVGIGWSLSAGGVITRTLKSIPDETPGFGFINTPPLPNNNFDGNAGKDLAFRKFNSIYGGVLDAEMDVFSFNFNGRSGKFVFGKNNDFLMLTQQKLKVEKEIGNVSGQTMIIKFIIIDELGYQYVFNDYELTLSEGIAFGAAKRFTSSWYLSEIVAPTGLEKMTFQYESTGYRYAVANSLSIGVATIGSNIPAAPGRASTLHTSITGKRIKTIVFPDGGSVSFTYNTLQRKDLPGDYALAGMTVQNGVQNWGFQFYQDYSLNRLTLAKVILWEGKSRTVKGDYNFEYSNEARLPDRLTLEQDHWGFFNSNPSKSMIPAETFQNPVGGYSNLPGGNRNTHATRIKAGTLKKIVYPTGGHTIFEMEANRVDDPRVGQNVIVGGLRVKKISDFDKGATSPSIVREYEYSMENSTQTSGRLGIFPVYSHSVFYDKSTPVHAATASYTPAQPNQVMRATSPIHEISYVNGSPVTYTRVVEKVVNGVNYEGKTVSHFTSFFEGSVAVLKSFPYVPPNFKQWTYGLLTTEEIYDRNGALLRKTANEYGFPSDNYFSSPARQENFRSITIAPVKYNYLGKSHTFISDYWTKQGDPIFFLSESYLPPSGRSELKKKTIYDYKGRDVMVTENTYVYNQSFYNLKSETSKNSTGKNVTKNYVQPFDMVSLKRDPTGVYQAMVGRNIISPVVELTEYNNSTPIYLIRNNYFNPYTSVYVPKTVVTKKGTVPEDTVYRYKNYDIKGKLLMVSKADWGAETSFLWGYNGQYPIAEVKNATHDQISHTSFETNEKGGWIYSGLPISAGSRTGRRHYSLNSGAITKTATGASAAKPFKLSFWARRTSGSGPWTFMGRTENLGTGWQLIEREVTTATLSISGSGILVDELRLHPADAPMITYTYDPLIGITSNTDVRNYTTYYEYDGMGRLKSIKNEDGHILEHYDYHYTTGN